AGRLQRLRDQADRPALSAREDRETPPRAGAVVSGDSRPLETAPRQAAEDAGQDLLPRKARLAQKREQLLAPASALRELGKMLLKDARDRGREDFQADMQQIHALAERLVEMIGGLLDAHEGEAEEGFEKRLRHDLRTPPTEIIGLCEIWLED